MASLLRQSLLRAPAIVNITRDCNLTRPLTFQFQLPKQKVQSNYNRHIVRAMEVSGPGAIDSALITSMRDKIKYALQTEEVVVTDVNGDGRHVSINVVSNLFEGKRSLDRQRMVYKAIWEELSGVVHAVDSLVTKTPGEVSGK